MHAPLCLMQSYLQKPRHGSNPSVHQKMSGWRSGMCVDKYEYYSDIETMRSSICPLSEHLSYVCCTRMFQHFVPFSSVPTPAIWVWFTNWTNQPTKNQNQSSQTFVIFPKSHPQWAEAQRFIPGIAGSSSELLSLVTEERNLWVTGQSDF